MFTYLPLIQLLTQLHLLLDGLQQLAVDLEDVDAGPGQLDFSRVLTSHGLVPNFPRPADDLVLGEVCVADIPPGRVPLLPNRLQLHVLQRALPIVIKLNPVNP